METETGWSVRRTTPSSSEATGRRGRKWGRHCCRPHCTGCGHRRMASLLRRASETMSPGARAGIRSRQAVGPVQAPFRPAWRFRDRSFRGGPAFHLVRFWPKPFPSHPRRAETSGQPAACPRVPSTCHAAIRGSRRTGLFPGRAAFAAVSNCPTVCCLSVFVTLRFRGLPEAIGLLASMSGCCAHQVSRSSFASPIYPPKAVLAVDKCG